MSHASEHDLQPLGLRLFNELACHMSGEVTVQQGAALGMGRCSTVQVRRFLPMKKRGGFPKPGSNDTKTTENGGADRFDEENEQIVVMTGPSWLHNQCDVPMLEASLERLAMSSDRMCRKWHTFRIQNFHLAKQVELTATGGETDPTRRQ